jgi:hypothetical protein
MSLTHVSALVLNPNVRGVLIDVSIAVVHVDELALVLGGGRVYVSFFVVGIGVAVVPGLVIHILVVGIFVVRIVGSLRVDCARMPAGDTR